MTFPLNLFQMCMASGVAAHSTLQLRFLTSPFKLKMTSLRIFRPPIVIEPHVVASIFGFILNQLCLLLPRRESELLLIQAVSCLRQGSGNGFNIP